jgi:hypothetical protein
MPKHQTSQRNPFNDNPDNSDYVERFRLFNIREGQDPEEAGINAFQEMDHYIKNGIDPAGPANAREAGINERNSNQLAREMQKGALLEAQTAKQLLGLNFNNWLKNQGRSVLPTSKIGRQINPQDSSVNRNIPQFDLPIIKF